MPKKVVEPEPESEEEYESEEDDVEDEGSSAGEEEDEENESDDEEVPETNGNTMTDHEDVVDDLNYDLFNLLASNTHPLVWKKSSKREEVLLEEATRAAQLLYNKLSALPTEMSETGPVLLLPTETTSMPRFKKVPEPKPETKWEKFAREKGIQKKKKDRMVFNEDTGEFAPRFGYKRSKNGLDDLPIVEIKPGDDPYADPWAEDHKKKKERVDKNRKQKLMNEKRALKAKGKGVAAKPYSPEAIPGIPVGLESAKGGKRGKAGVKNALSLAQLSTASMGRFDDYRTGEPERKLGGTKRKFRDNFESLESEKRAMKAQIRFVDDKKTKKEKGVTNSLAAYEGILPDAPSNTFKKSKGKGQSGGKSFKKRK